MEDMISPRAAELIAIGELVAENGRLQAKVDSLMLEYCPNEMTSQQVSNWERHQQPSEIEV